MTWWIWNLRPYPDVFVGLMLVQLIPWMGTLGCCVSIRLIRPGWSSFLRAFLTSVCGMSIFFLLFGGLTSLAEHIARWHRVAKGIDITWSRGGELYYSYQGQRDAVGGLLGGDLLGFWPCTEAGLVIGLWSSLIWIPVLALLNVVWATGFGGAARILWHTIKSGHATVEQESSKIAILLDLIPTIVLIALFSVAGAFLDVLVIGPFLDFGLVHFVFSTLPWGMGLIICIALRKRLAHGRRWVRSFLIAVYTYIFWDVSQGPLMALSQEATHWVRSIFGTHQGPNMFDSPWCFYDSNSGMNWGSGFAEMRQDTVFDLQYGLYALPYVLGFLLLVCAVNDYLIRLFKFTFKTVSP